MGLKSEGMSSEGGTAPAGQGVSIVPDDVLAVGRRAADLAQSLRSALRVAENQVNSLTSTGWTGSAATAFTTGWDECHDGGGRIIDALVELAGKLGVSAATYQSQDATTASRVSSLDL